MDPDHLRQAAAEQAALRRVATLVARRAPRAELFEALITEIGRLMPANDAALIRLDGGETGTMIGRWNNAVGYETIGIRHAIGSGTLAQLVSASGRPSRVTTYASSTGPLAEMIRGWGWRSSVGAPVIVDARVWGVTSVGSTTDDQLPPGTEQRLAGFTELLAIAIADAQSSAQLEQLLAEQAALRQVAVLVSRQAAPADVFSSIATAVGALLGADGVSVQRFEGDGQATTVAGWGEPDLAGYVGLTHPIAGDNPVAMALATGRPARRVYQRGDRGVFAEISLRVGIVSAVASPIVVDGRPWGAIVAVSMDATPLAPATEARLQDFTELAATGIANVKAQTELMESRVRLVRAGDEARARVARDLHDGAQQRLVHTIITLKLARNALEQDDGRAKALIAEALDQAERANAELRELAHGILPAALTSGGLRAGIDSLAARLELPVDVDVEELRLPPEIEASAYFIAAEALTNVIKHARASSAGVTAAANGDELRLEIRDDGIGGADPEGHGLVGMRDRATTLGGRLDVDSPAGGGTVVTATLGLGD